MASTMWRKIQHQNKRATKFRVVARFIELVIECTPKWQPAAVCVAWVHRKRRYVSKVCNWEPSITNPYCGIILWPSQCTETLEIVTTLYRDQRSEEFDDKEWTFVVEEVANSGRRFRPIASAKLNMRMFANETPGTMSMLKLQLRPLRESLQKCTLELLLGCTVLKEGAAIDDDMRSLASILSSQPSKDVGDLHDFDDEFGSGSSVTVPAACPAESSHPSTNGFADERWKPQTAEVANEVGALEKVPSAVVVTSTTVLSNDSFKSICDGELHGRTESPKSDQKSVAVEHSHQASGPTRRPMMTSTPTETRSSSGFFDSLLSSSMAKRDSVTNDSQASVTSQDLLSWCQESCRGYRGVRISNFSSSWRNGIAFAALIHRYRPDLIDFDSLSPTEIRENCRKAFDAAALLNVPRLIDPNDMVIMTIPDKIAVMTYVYNLKAALTGASPVNDTDVSEALTAGSKSSQSSGRPSSIVSPDTNSEPRAASNPLNVSVPSEPAKSMRSRLASGDEQAPLSYTLSASSIQKPVLMTRKELMNPFDSDEESQTAETLVASTVGSADADIVPTGAPAAAAEQADIDSSAVVGESREEELRRRVREMVEKFPVTDEKAKISAESERFQELTSRARQIIKEFEPGGKEPTVIRLSEMLHGDADDSTGTATATAGKSHVPFSAPATRQATPEASSATASRTSINSVHHGCPRSAGARLPSPITKESLLISTGTTPVANKALQSVVASESAFARFKRFGSMRGQELAQSINVLSSRLGETVRTGGGQKEAPDDHLSEEEKPPTKIVTPLDLELQLQSVTEEMEALVAKQKELDHRAIEVEKQWRTVMQKVPGSEQEQQLMNDYLSLLNERNMLTRREMHLSLLETIRSYETRFAGVQKELAELMETEESEKTEALKQRIDFLMDELISIVNKRDELVQQLMAHDQGTEEDAEMAHNVLKNSILMDTDDHKNCVIQ